MVKMMGGSPGDAAYHDQHPGHASRADPALHPSRLPPLGTSPSCWAAGRASVKNRSEIKITETVPFLALR